MAMWRQRGEKGSAAVEFALILPIFLMLLFGIIDFGYMINRSSMINNAARDGVREASLGASRVEVERTTNASLGDVPDTSIDVRCKLPSGSNCGHYDSDRVSGGIAVVEVRYEHEMLTPVGMFFPGGFDLTRKAEMRIE